MRVVVRVLLVGAVVLAGCGDVDLSEVPDDEPTAAATSPPPEVDDPPPDGADDDGAGDDGADDDGSPDGPDGDLRASLGDAAEAATRHALARGIGVSVPDGFESDALAMTDDILQLRHEDGRQEVLAVDDVDQRQDSEWEGLGYEDAIARAATLGDGGLVAQDDVEVDGAARARAFLFELPDDRFEQLLVLADSPTGLAVFIYLGTEGRYDPATAALVLDTATLEADPGQR